MASIQREGIGPGTISAGSITNVRVQPVIDDAGWRDARAIIAEHVRWVTAALGIGDMAAVQPSLRDELADLTTFYTPPRGRLLLAWLDGEVAGSVGVAVTAERTAEMKRLYVRPAARGHSLGELLVRAALRAAGDLGCHTLWLSTMPGAMDTAIALYRRLGFRDVPPVAGLDIDDALYLARPVPLPAGC
ncbi:MAG: GNAT family N-acetyltransferase [Dehalococcoidia bacterium]